MGLRSMLMKNATVAMASRLTERLTPEPARPWERAADWATRRIRPQPKRRSGTATAMMGLGAAAVALPIGLWLGRRARDSGTAGR